MKYYTYFPGCSAESTAIGLDRSLQAITGPLEIKFVELEDWTCCGSTPYGSLDETESFVIVARNLALAEVRGLDLVTPCSNCFVTLNKGNIHLQNHPALMAQVNEALGVAGLEYHGSVRVRQAVEVLVSDITPESIASRVRQNLNGLEVAPYYGCQMVRPDYGTDNPEFPQSLDRLVECLGARAVNFPLKARCCGGSFTISEEDKVLGLMRLLLENAVENGAQCIATPCPLCQTNLDAFQGRVNARYRTGYHLPVFFVSQLIGLALGLDPLSLGLNTNIVSPGEILESLGEVEVGT